MSMGDKFIDMVLTLAIVLTVLTGFLVGLIYDAGQNENLTAYVGLLGLIVVIVIIGCVRYAWKTFSSK
jgi:uncharacterized membrane protein